jgi:hypothetical protein
VHKLALILTADLPNLTGNLDFGANFKPECAKLSIFTGIGLLYLPILFIFNNLF